MEKLFHGVSATLPNAVTAVYQPLLGDVSVNILAGGPPLGAIGLSTSKTGLQRAVYYRPGVWDALWIGFSNTLPVGCVPKTFEDDTGRIIPTLVILDCYGRSWQAALSKSGRVFSVKPL